MGLDAEDLATLKSIGLNVMLLIATTFALIGVATIFG